MPSAPSAARSGRRGPHKLNAAALFASLGLFVVLSLVGGVLAGALVAPFAVGASKVTSGGVELFDTLPTDIEAGKLSEASYLFASDGKTLLATYYWENRIIKPLGQINKNLQNAVIATEDKRFYEHGAIDMMGMSRALVNNAMERDTQGASTLTQQYVKNLLIEKANSSDDSEGVTEATEGTYERKLREARLAIALEKTMTKDEILEGYLNIAQFGKSVYGAEAAAQHYFSVPAADLSVVQAATIAGITQRPNAYDPTVHPEAAERRRNIVLNLMYQQSVITREEYEEARNTPLADTLDVQEIKQGCTAAKSAAFFCDYVTKVITQDPVFGKTTQERTQLLYRGGLRIVTTIDLKLQKKATKILKDSIPANEANGIATAMTSVQPGTGEIVVMAQNRSYDASENPKKYTTAINYNTDQEHGGSRGFQPGSTFKPYTLVAWLRAGKRLNDVVDGTGRTYQQSSFRASCTSFGGTYAPGNSEGVRRGRMSVLTATAQSVNTGYIAMANQLDQCDIADAAYDTGFRPSLTNGEDLSNSYFTDDGVEVTPSMTLGIQNTSPLAQAAAFATFANQGKYCEPIAILSVTTTEGKKLDVPKANCRRTITADIANTVTYALQRVPKAGGSAPGAALSGGRPSAGKTGTAGNSTHTWFVGFTPQLSTAVWVGNPSKDVVMRGISVAGRPRQTIFGSTIAAPEWKSFMDVALAKKPVKQFPAPAWSMVGPAPVLTTNKDEKDKEKDGDKKSSDSGKDKGKSSGKGSSKGKKD
ncbi:transglycosylase domain-containing protein [Rarobacter faecitabidus]|uniref:Membrane peptidoglycan carboxypeptidase n=1 Tax=Rarobacter faecitabidus TaxID=13243 RepID=A0A542ZTB3_RARFA|nr:transglycosylase domain-containing protein [Rarobacter faecitabidus]TQL63595.1 membrane peptidoglycan carboxypeptidase [Rarobacter faecitabidus]